MRQLSLSSLATCARCSVCVATLLLGCTQANVSCFPRRSLVRALNLGRRRQVRPPPYPRASRYAAAIHWRRLATICMRSQLDADGYTFILKLVSPLHSLLEAVYARTGGKWSNGRCTHLTFNFGMDRRTHRRIHGVSDGLGPCNYIGSPIAKQKGVPLYGRISGILVGNRHPSTPV
jgi:hypothetical protein